MHKISRYYHLSNFCAMNSIFEENENLLNIAVLNDVDVAFSVLYSVLREAVETCVLKRTIQLSSNALTHHGIINYLHVQCDSIRKYRSCSTK